ncbi:MAG: SGNH/GDSL hydrolase family protein [Prolixibacteraceae bacterium]
MYKKIKLLFLLLIVCVAVSFSPKRISWIAIGDSITYLNEHKEETGNRIERGYMTRVVEKLPNITYTNQGHNGWTSEKIAANLEKLGLEKADVYSIFLGTNDWWQGRKVGTMADYQNNTGNTSLYGSFRIIVNKLRNLNPDAKIIFITPMQRVDFVYIADYKNNAWGSYKDKNGQSLAQFAEAISAIGKSENFAVVDLFNNSKMEMKNLVKFKRLKDPQTNSYKNYPYPKFIGVPFNPETDEYPYPAEAIDITYDGLHPSDQGYDIIAGLLVKVLEKY